MASISCQHIYKIYPGAKVLQMIPYIILVINNLFMSLQST